MVRLTYGFIHAPAAILNVTPLFIMVVYFCGQYMEKSKVVISPDDRGFLFADGVYEVVRAYQGRFFMLAEHFSRLEYGLKELKIEGVDLQALQAAAQRLLSENGLEEVDSTLYLQITRGIAPRSHHFPRSRISPTIYLEVKPCPDFTLTHQTGMPAIIVPDQRWARCDIKSVALLPNILASQRAHEAGAFEAIFSRNGILTEGSHSGILFVKHGLLLFPPLTTHILASITRSVVHSLAVAASIPTAIQSCHECQLEEFEEILMIGTSVEIVPIITVDGRKVGEGIPGSLSRKLQGAFRRHTQTH